MKKLLLFVFLVTINQVVKSQTINRAAAFSGSSNSAAAMGTVTELNGVNKFSFEAWIYINQWNENSYIFSKIESVKSRIDIQLGSVASKRLYFHVSNGANSYAALDNSSIQVGQWNHIAMAYDGTKSAYNMMRVYINGVQATKGIFYSSGNGLLPTTTPSNNAVFELGKNFNGRIDEVKLWNFAVAASDLEMRNTINVYHPLYSNLISYWKMDQIGSTVIDAKNQHNGILAPASLTAVADNPSFKYKIVSSYIRSNFYENGQISEEYIRNNNDIVYMAASPYENGDLFFEYPINTGVLNNAVHLSNFGSRNGVISFAGTGSSMNTGKDLLNKANGGVGAFSFATWVYIDQWNENSFIFRKYNSATQTIDLQLGSAANKELIFHLSNGSDNNVSALNSGLTTGGWHHVAVTYSGNSGANQQAKIYINGVSVPLTFKNANGLLATTGPFIRSDFELGVGFSGKLDETSLNLFSLSSTEINSIMNNPIAISTWNSTKTNAYWKYDDAFNPGKDSRTWVSVLESLKQTISGYEGAKIRLGVTNGDWLNMINSNVDRLNFANKIAAVMQTNGFDGVDLDFEWAASTQNWTDYSATILALDAALPATSEFSVTLHPLYYKITSQAIAALDFISIQSYGPSPDRFPYGEFVNNVTAMLNYGFPAQKLVMGLPFYAVTTDNTKVTTSYKTILAANPTLDPTLDVIDLNVNGIKNFTFNGQRTIFNKTKHVQDKDLAGVMYWDMGTDVDYTNQLSLLRELNKVMNANLDLFSTGNLSVENHFNQLDTLQSNSNLNVYPNPAKSSFTIELAKEEDGTIEIFNLAGNIIMQQVFNNQKVLKIDINNFKTGIYLVKYVNQDGNGKSAKLVIN
ncbi:LamG-like jellyroll fold domain-containing protein [Flavobacterium sp. TMP13]|uniref:LamG-like jellyroll fold domain-containing protein n=1 Tax=Flavobacterium sp. TMP13 TaxID=3425950 RepID=UPI003D77C89A